MRTICRKKLSVLLGLIGGFLSQQLAQAAEPPVEIKVVKYSDLIKTVKDFKGKVVVVDFWQDTCIACKKEFPHLVEMYHKYEKQGFVAVSVNLDDPHAPGMRDKALRFLQMKKAVFTNIMLDEKVEVWQKKLNIASLPTVIVFNRSGKIAQRFPIPKREDAGFTYADVEKIVVPLLKQK